MKDPTDWLEDFSIYLSEEEIIGMISDVEDTLVFTGSKPIAAVSLTLTGVLGGIFGGVLGSGQLWTSFLFVPAYLVALSTVWLGMRKVIMRIFGPAIRWQAVLSFFWRSGWGW